MRRSSSVRFALSSAVMLIASLVLVQGCSQILFDGFDKAESGAGGAGNVGGASNAGGSGDGGAGAGGMSGSCDPNVCDNMDEECLDFSCNDANSACDSGVAVPSGNNCLITTRDVCNENGVCVPIGCTNGFQDGEETDLDCGGPVCDGCNNGLMCNGNSDCRSNSCGMGSGTCQPCTDADCNAVADTYCDDENADQAEHVCKPKRSNGNACDAATHQTEECLSDFCVDGVCCDTACNAPDCESCLGIATGQIDGTCAPVQAGTDPDGDCTENLGPSAVNGCEGNNCSGTLSACAPASAGGTCRSAPLACDASETCDGVSLGCPADNPEPSSTVCNPLAGPCDVEETCDGTAFTCPTNGYQPDGFDPGTCNGYLCSGNSAACPNTCTSDNDCVSTHFCSGISCVPKIALGGGCMSNNQCDSANCVDGFCCSMASCATCQECNGAGGTCANVPQGVQDDDSCFGATQACDGMSGAGSCKEANGSSCMSLFECASGFCADGYCCDSACAGTCEACAGSINIGGDGVCSDIVPNTDPNAECPGADNCCNSGICQMMGAGICM